MFKIIESKIDTQGKLIYLESSHEFISEPSINSDITILVGYIYIGFDSENNESTQVWGFHHNFNWKSSDLTPPKATKGKVVLNGDINSGDSKRITGANSWKTVYDKSSGWVRFGGENNSLKISYVEFFPYTIMGIDENGDITELWLKPIMK
ncbi:hypothetical protein CI088_03915 [Enterococcus plantarum]|uniref:Uncharacterized protein n=1 Tax=Enterococcus plantarum TaxID=1077675 RepID=A0A2W3ZPD2_9ENTE|nr:hypothetical protein [Enterococcus plantarum]PZL75101.1 hypothetical protein CI088_05920 [Enterococcus plantarum]PZL75994.1 hypothetical protein CI088_03915 [Enterococcus plantarum]